MDLSSKGINDLVKLMKDQRQKAILLNKSGDFTLIRQNNSSLISGTSYIILNFNDLDLHVKTPSGQFINYSKKQLFGGHLDSDKNIHNQPKILNPIENIRWDKNPPKGKYEIYATLYSKDDRNKFENTNYKIIVHKNQKIVGSFKNNFTSNNIKKRVKLFDYEVK